MTLFRLLIALAFAVPLLFTVRAVAAEGEARVALIIGNSSYRQAPLLNPANDASDLATALEKRGFNVLLREDVSERGLKEAVEDFAKYLRKGGVGLFFFAGHGVQLRDQNYLVPVDISFNSEADILFKSVSAEYVLSRMAEAGNRVNIVILDACRDNPLQASRPGVGKGLGAMNVGRAEKGTFIAYATSPGTTAADGDGRNGLYTKNLLASLSMADTDIDKVFGRVRGAVVNETGGRQVPWTSSSMVDSFYFDVEEGRQAALRQAAQPAVAAPVIAAPVPSAYDPVQEQAAWERVRNSQNADDYRSYLERFSGGPNAAFARFRLKRFGGDPASVVPKTVAPAALPVAPARPAAPVPTPVPTPAPPPAPASAPKPAAPVAPPVVAPQPQSAAAGLRDCPACPELVVIPPGEFVMGRSSGPGQEPDESPAHAVRIAAPLAIGKFEVTREQYAAFVRETGHSSRDAVCNSVRGGRFVRSKKIGWQSPGYPQTSGDPVVCVSWDDAQAYIAWLKRNTGKAYRLPSEAEWEYAARAGGPGDRYWGSDVAAACQHANVADQTAHGEVAGLDLFPCRDKYPHTAPVGRFEANAFGLHDMLGNAWEWVDDCWNPNYQGAPADGGAWRTGQCDQRVFRGGAWNGKPQNVRAGFRDREERVERHDNLGFRVARPID
jgi:formylglycine-generating enzyme required for sulfatase activity